MTRGLATAIDLLSPHQRRRPMGLQDEIPFGRIPTNHMFICDYLKSYGGWQRPQIVAVHKFEMAPSSIVFHYGQEIFEGLKAYFNPDTPDKFHLFRHDRNAARMFHSARRLGMVEVPHSLFMTAVEELVQVESEWLLPEPGSLYIRPALIPLDEGVSYRAGESYRFFVILSPAKNYYGKEDSIAINIEREFVRAAPGGSGEAKCGGNYASALPGLKKARAKGADQCLWLDAIHRTYVEEVGTMNIMFSYGAKILTPELNGSILPGVTRESLIELARHLGYQVEETKIDIHEIINDAKSKKLDEVFGCGTAAVVTPVGELIDGDERIIIGNGTPGPIATRLKNELVGIQNGKLKDVFGWRKTFDINPVIQGISKFNSPIEYDFW